MPAQHFNRTLVAAIMEILSKYFVDLVHTRTSHKDILHQSMDKRKSGVLGMSRDRTLPMGLNRAGINA